MNTININIRINKIYNGYVVSGNPIHEILDSESNENQVYKQTKDEAESLVNEAMTNELSKLQ